MPLLSLLARLTSQIAASEAAALDTAVRYALISLSFHTSNRNAVHFIGENTPRTVCMMTPTQLCGAGKIMLSKGVIFGCVASPGNFSCSRIEARTPESIIILGENTIINNRACFGSEGASIRIGKDCLIGPDCQIFDTNGHELAVAERKHPDKRPLPVSIGNDVFIGSRVTILKGVTVGNGCIIAAGAVLFPRFTAADCSVIAGNPAVVVRTVPPEIPVATNCSAVGPARAFSQ